MRSPRHDEQGLVGVVLTIVIVWALIAVVMLTRTLVAAQQIDSTVVGIRGSVQSANNHLNTGCAANTTCSDSLPVLATTEAIAKDIDAEAKPLSDQAKNALAGLQTINATAALILANATSIHNTVVSINGFAGSIGASVNGIHSSLSGVLSTATAAKAGVAQINTEVGSAMSVVDGIKGDTNSINTEAAGILTQARGICADKPGIVGIGLLGVVCG